MARLGVNIDHVATLRQARKTAYPDPVTAANLAMASGADNITCHLREDRRHIQDRDVRILKETVPGELNLEIAATEEMLRFALDLKPNVVTLVPEKRQELTTEGGLDLAGQIETITKAVALLREGGITVSLFIDPDPTAVDLARRAGAKSVEIHTGRYAHAVRAEERKRELDRVAAAVASAAELRMAAHAGHGLNYHNIGPVAALGGIESFQIGHAIVAQAILVGFSEAVRRMKSLIAQAGH